MAQPYGPAPLRKWGQRDRIRISELHNNHYTWNQIQALQLAERCWVTIAQAANDCRFSCGPIHKRDFIGKQMRSVLMRYHMPMGIDLGIAQQGRHAVFETLRDKVLQPFGFFMYLVQRVFEDVV